ncbi:L domain-like protein [Phellopilus nigrolimitatus]|nr:L domain-like protein [Phellopilus nigrolimitatus]
MTDASTDPKAPTVEAVNVVDVAAKSTGKKRAAVVVQPDPVNGADTDEGEEYEDADGGEDEDGDLLEDLPDDTDEIELVHSRLQNLQNLRLPRFGRYLKKLCLRQNQISLLDPEIFGALTELVELDLYDNKVKNTGSGLDACTKLNVLDLSFNLLRAIPECLEHFQSLRTVYFVQNRISKIDGLSSLGASLRSLELGGNRIRRIENLESLENLEELWLGKNKISKFEGLQNLRHLKILSIQSNRITKLEGLEELHSLEELYISHNGVELLEGLENNKKLRVLDVSNNYIKKLEGVSHLSELEELWASNNRITTLTDLEPQLAHLKALETVYLEGNPVQRSEGAAYRRKINLALPQLKQIDATYVKMF